MMRTEFAATHQDTVSGREEEQNALQEGEDQYVTIQRAAQLCAVSDKTIQRAIHRGVLPAQYPKKNRCEIAIRDLERIRPGLVSGHGPESLEQRVVTLELRVQQLEQLVTALLDKPVASKRHSKAKAPERTTGPLPKRFVSLLAFARLHNIAESTVQTHVDMRLFSVERGTWTDTDGTEVMLALDAKGRAAFYHLYHLYHSFPQFLSCSHCAHGYQDNVSGQD